MPSRVKRVHKLATKFSPQTKKGMKLNILPRIYTNENEMNLTAGLA